MSAEEQDAIDHLLAAALIHDLEEYDRLEKTPIIIEVFRRGVLRYETDTD